MVHEVLSPRLRAIASAADRRAAAKQLWKDLTGAGYPLVEPDPYRATHRLVTFVWRWAPGTVSVHHLSDLGRNDPAPLERLADTDIGYLTYQVRADLRMQYRFLLDVPADILAAADWRQWRPFQQLDPLNSLVYRVPAYDQDPATVDETYSVVELDQAPAQPWLGARAGVARGCVTQVIIESPTLQNCRRVWIYSPPTGAAAADIANGGSLTSAGSGIEKPSGMLVLLDGWTWAKAIGIAPMMDNLIAENLVPPLVVAMPEELPGTVRFKEYGLDDGYLRFLTDELVPLVHAYSPVRADTAHTIIAGQSLGGLTAAFAGLRRPDIFGNILSQSGSFWWPHGSEFGALAESLTRRYASTARVPVNVYLDVGLLDEHNLVPNRHLRDVLLAKGYPFDYTEFNGGHSWLCWRGTLADGLISLTERWSDG